MIEEIQAAVNFLIRLIAKNESLSQDSIERMSANLCQLLKDRFQDHWFPDRPNKGQGYRCIRINENDRRDPSLEQACIQCGISYEHLKLPIELTLWVDPEEVTCRFGEHKGSYCIVAKFRDGSEENFMDQINIDELEQKSLERSKQASFDILNSRKKRQQQMQNGRNKNGYISGYNNGFIDYKGIIPTTSSPSSYYPFYANGTPFNAYGSSPPHPNNLFNVNNKFPISPPQSRSLNTAAYRGGGKPGYSPNGTIGAKGGSNGFSRGLQTAFSNATFGSPFPSYQQNDRYHWVNKSIVKA